MGQVSRSSHRTSSQDLDGGSSDGVWHTDFLGLGLPGCPLKLYSSLSPGPPWQLERKGPEEGWQNISKSLSGASWSPGTPDVLGSRRKGHEVERGGVLQGSHHTHHPQPVLHPIPAENGRRLSCHKISFLFRKWPGFNCRGGSPNTQGHRAEARLGKMMVPSRDELVVAQGAQLTQHPTLTLG